ncbi:hypothetical protein EVAR_33224_1 [Eumeta japonica]|uniref:Uncharacterized protein n=1 Tax=Eumeta variegata TaxID=151549 RepID=A0A4C1W3P5_EUMVA|nr:hypothetical protein EVAR_33224_1 [Eumeta japonica]
MSCISLAVSDSSTKSSANLRWLRFLSWFFSPSIQDLHGHLDKPCPDGGRPRRPTRKSPAAAAVSETTACLNIPPPHDCEYRDLYTSRFIQSENALVSAGSGTNTWCSPRALGRAMHVEAPRQCSSWGPPTLF